MYNDLIKTVDDFIKEEKIYFGISRISKEYTCYFSKISEKGVTDCLGTHTADTLLESIFMAYCKAKWATERPVPPEKGQLELKLE